MNISIERRRIVFSFFSVVLGVLLALIMAELALRITKGDSNPAGNMDPGFILYDERLGWKLAPGWRGGHRHDDFNVNYSVNTLGFRGKDKGFSRQVTTVFLGDSFTFGLGVDDNAVFTSLLHSLSYGEVLNAGIPGYANDQQLLLIERLIDFKPETLIWMVYLGNDLLDNGQPFPLQAAHGKPYAQVSVSGGLVFKNVPVPLKQKPHDFRSKSVMSEILGEYQPYSFWQRWISGYEIGRIINQLVGIDADGFHKYLKVSTEKQVELFLAIVNAGNAMLQEAGIDLEVVLLPGKGYTYVDSIPGIYQKTIASALTSKLKSADIAVFDAGSYLLTVDRPQRLFHPNEGHFNRAGHRWLADTLTEIREN